METQKRPEILVRSISEDDVDAIINLYKKVYGPDFPFREFYDPVWVRRGIYNDDILWRVAEIDGKIAGSGAVIINVGDHDDLMGEFGRLVVDPGIQKGGIGASLSKSIIEEVAPSVEMIFAEARTAHTGAQRILLKLGFVPAGFEPLKYLVLKRESFIFFIRLFGNASKLRRNNPEVIKEVFHIGTGALTALGLEPDLIVKADAEPYPASEHFRIQMLEDNSAYRLLRIEQGRIADVEVFGGVHLDYGYLKVKSAKARYLVCREREHPVGAVGFIIDDIDCKARIFELIAFDDMVRGTLLKKVTELAEHEHHVEYIEIDVSAYSPRIQRTLDLLGYVPVAYCPAMVFQSVQRLDVIRMAKIICPYNPGELQVLEECMPVMEMVDHAICEKSKGVEINDIMRHISIFDGLNDYQVSRIGEICIEKSFKKDEIVFGRGSKGAECYIVTRGKIEISDETQGGEVIALVDKGEIFGEFALLDSLPRSMSAVCRNDAEVLIIRKPDFENLMTARNDIGAVVYRNISRTLVSRLRKTTVGLSEWKRRFSEVIDTD